MIRRVYRISLIAALAVLAGATLVYAVAKTLEPGGAIDFHSYWYVGHFIRQGIDPYQAYLEKITPVLPVSYLDGITLQEPLAQPGLATVPANTAPIVLLLSSLAFFTWPTAKIIWMAANILFMFTIPVLVIRWLPERERLDRFSAWVIILAFLGMFGTRNIAGNGQTSLAVFTLMLLALLDMKRSELRSGIWLGLALSKYSLSLPLFIFFIILRRYRSLAVSLVVQAAGVLLLSIITSTTPLAILWEYVAIFQVHTSLPGIHLGSLFPNSPLAGWAAVLVMTAAVATALIIWLRRNRHRLQEENWFSSCSGDHILTALALWTLLVAYHRAYDTFIAILFIALVIYGLKHAQTWQIPPIQRTILIWLTTLAYIPLSLPARGISFITGSLPNQSLTRWLDFQGGLLTLTLLALLAGTLWLLYRITDR